MTWPTFPTELGASGLNAVTYPKHTKIVAAMPRSDRTPATQTSDSDDLPVQAHRAR